MACAVEGRTRSERLGRDPLELRAELLLDQPEKFLDAETVEHVFEPRLGPVGAVAVIDEDAHNGVGDLRCFGRPHDEAGLSPEIVMPGDAADGDTEPHARFYPEAVLHLDRRKTDVVRVLQHRITP